MARKIVVVTGATGLVGRQLTEALARRGHRVRALVRRRDAALAALPGVTLHDGELPDRIDARAFADADVVVHAAYVTNTRAVRGEDARRINEDGTRRVRELAQLAGAPRFVFVSTTSASADAQAYYGASKWRLEREMDPAKDLVIRLGLVLARDAGMFARLAQGRGPWVVPLFGGGAQPMQTIHVDDAIAGLVNAVELGMVGVRTLAGAERTTMREVFAAVARQLGRRPVFVPVPSELALRALRAAERLGVGTMLPISAENVLGLLRLRYVDSREDLAALGVSARSLEEALRDLFPS